MLKRGLEKPVTSFDMEIHIFLGIGGCEIRDLPRVKNARRIPVRPFRGSVVKFKCSNGYSLYGERLFNCQGYNKWSDNPPPVCAREFAK